jgi:uncharacterized phage protein gp47/JayE
MESMGQYPMQARLSMLHTGKQKEALGNVPPETLTHVKYNPSTASRSTNLTVTNPDYASGGADFESMEDIRNRAPRSLRSLDRAVTYQDYIDIALQVVGVGAAEVSYCCGKYVSVYIVPGYKRGGYCRITRISI